MPTVTPINRAPAPRGAHASPAIIDAAPIQELLASITGELATLSRLSPNSDARAALCDVRERLTSALTEAAAGNLWMTAEEYAEREGVTASAITYRCRAGKLRWRKQAGRYLIDPRFAA